MLAKPEERNGFSFFNFAEISMIGSNKRTVQLDSGRHQKYKSIIIPGFGKKLSVPLFFYLVVPSALFKEAVHRNRSVLAERPNFFQRGVKIIDRFFSGKPTNFKASGCSNRNLRRNFKIQIHSVVSRNFYSLRNAHGGEHSMKRGGWQYGEEGSVMNYTSAIICINCSGVTAGI